MSNQNRFDADPLTAAQAANAARAADAWRTDAAPAVPREDQDDINAPDRLERAKRRMAARLAPLGK